MIKVIQSFGAEEFERAVNEYVKSKTYEILSVNVTQQEGRHTFVAIIDVYERELPPIPKHVDFAT